MEHILMTTAYIKSEYKIEINRTIHKICESTQSYLYKQSKRHKHVTSVNKSATFD